MTVLGREIAEASVTGGKAAVIQVGSLGRPLCEDGIEQKPTKAGDESHKGIEAGDPESYSHFFFLPRRSKKPSVGEGEGLSTEWLEINVFCLSHPLYGICIMPSLPGGSRGKEPACHCGRPK